MFLSLTLKFDLFGIYLRHKSLSKLPQERVKDEMVPLVDPLLASFIRRDFSLSVFSNLCPHASVNLVSDCIQSSSKKIKTMMYIVYLSSSAIYAT